MSVANVIASVPETASLEEVFARLYRTFKEKTRLARFSLAQADLDEELPPELEEAVASLPLLDDEALWRAARNRVPEEAIACLEHLNRKRQAEGLSSPASVDRGRLAPACRLSSAPGEEGERPGVADFCAVGPAVQRVPADLVQGAGQVVGEPSEYAMFTYQY